MKNYNSEFKNKDKPIQTLSWENDACSLLFDEWERGKQYVSDLDDLYDDLYSMLRGERPEKHYDWESNVVINKVFQSVWTAIPYLTQKIFGSNPVIGISSSDKEGAWEREEILEFWNTMQPLSPNHTPYFLVVVMWTLRALLNGVGYVKKSYHQKLKIETFEEQVAVPMETDEQGRPVRVEPHMVRRKKSIPLEDWPVNQVVNNKDIVVDWLLEPTDSVRSGRFVIHRSMLDMDYLRKSGDYINLDKLDVNISMVNSMLRQDRSVNTQKDGQETVPESDIYAEVEVYERQGLLPVYKEDDEWRVYKGKDRDNKNNKNVQMKQMIMSVARAQGKEGVSDVLIRLEPNKLDEIGYIDMHIYLDAERWQSMGMVEPVKDLYTAINDNVNAMFDEIWANLHPPVILNQGALWEVDTIKYAPQQKWLMHGDPHTAAMFKPPTNITGDAWQKHILLDSEFQLGTSITPPMQGMGKEKAATTNVMNAQMSAGKLDFLIKMIEITGLIPSAQMDIRYAKKFTHPLTFQAILGRPFTYGGWEEKYRYVPAAASVKPEHQKETETLQDIQLLQTVASIQNPNVPKIINMFLRNILRNRNWDDAADLLDEDFYEPSSDAGNVNMLQRLMGGGNVPSNEKGLPMSSPEKNVRRLTFS